jgi:hypothetical protein
MHTRKPGGPKVFMSYARADLEVVEELATELRDRGIAPFLDVWHIKAGRNIVLEINKALTHSDYYVLLWSAAAESRFWVELEYTAALARERRLSRAFLFVVRLDDSDPPTLLAPRVYLDAFNGDRHRVADRLAEIWLRDSAVGVPVMPAPHGVPDDPPVPEPHIKIYVRNRELSVGHEITVPEKVTGRDLDGLIRRQLALPAEHSGFGGRVGVRFEYRFLLDGAPISGDTETLVPVNFGDAIDVEVAVEPYGPDGSLTKPVRYLPSTRPGGLSSATLRSLVSKAFDHLLP